MSETPLSPAQRARVVIPFLLVTLIWGSTWLVITDQLGVVPASWSVTYRFTVASIAMFAYAAWVGAPLRIERQSIAFVVIFGVSQFMLNFNFVYRAEQHVTSGLVALVFALLIVPNAVLGRIFLGQRLSGAFMAGSAIAIAGLALLFSHELETAHAGPAAVLTGIAFTVAGVLSASIANVMQGSRRAHGIALPTMMAWGMAVGALADGAYAWATMGPPVVEMRLGYFAGLLYLGLFASAIAFPLYFGIVRAIGPARAAYTSVLIPVIAMALSTLFEAYIWSWEAALGCALALAGLVVALSARRPAR
ncbi:MAG: multidrug transporter [Sphingomonas sp. SCN 67-18]|uniref:DMT family transporter n=1 Tax=uncultured Sphingomonas sp. TaxID=158754 RepID=UPI000869EDD7|nr:EamA family transporter [Sphingomonas sp. SCN 67-18]ODU20598.1 MAG: multidrug transporter [Sphingomonas sp. SCN 67-18]